MHDGFSFIYENFETESVSPGKLDDLLARGWRHFGTRFYRYNITIHEAEVRDVIPLRIRLSDFSLSKSQRRVLKRNADLQTIIRPISLTPDMTELFDRHKSRFRMEVPNSLRDFLSEKPDTVPVEAMELCAYLDGVLLAVSFFDIGECSISGVYASFEPTVTSRGLGIFTMLKEIEHARQLGKEYYYLGYCFEGESFYDYKKRFRATECYEWNVGWKPFGK